LQVESEKNYFLENSFFPYSPAEVQTAKVNSAEKNEKWPYLVSLSGGTHTVLGASPVRLILVAKKFVKCYFQLIQINFALLVNCGLNPIGFKSRPVHQITILSVKIN